MDDRIYDEPSVVEAEDGNVVVDGPDGVAVLLTPDAAAETSDRMLAAAAEAQGQIKAKERRERSPSRGSNG